MRYILPKTLVLDYRKWVCGNKGRGSSQLLNAEKEMCCLGQFYEQAGVQRSRLDGVGIPSSTFRHVSLLTKKYNKSILGVTPLSDQAVTINDCKSTTISEKVVALRKLFATKRRKIELKNFPKKILKEIKDLT